MTRRPAGARTFLPALVAPILLLAMAAAAPPADLTPGETSRPLPWPPGSPRGTACAARDIPAAAPEPAPGEDPAPPVPPVDPGDDQGEPGEAPAGGPADPEAHQDRPAPSSPATEIEAARALLEKDEFEEALEAARGLAKAHPGEAAVHTLLGDALYRRGDFEESEASYRRAIELDEECAGAQFGMGRILRTLGRYGDAAGHFHRAAALEPDNPLYIRTFANHLARREDVITTLKRYLEMPRQEEERIRKNVEAWIALLEFLGDEPMSELIEASRTDLPLNVLRGQAYLKADVNKIRGQRFAFDTGATGLTVSPRLAKRAKLKRIRPYEIVGMGGKGTVEGDLVLIRQLRVGGVTLGNVAAHVAEPKGQEEGLMGPPLFSALRIRIELRRGTLSLWPREGEGAGPPPGGTAVPFRNVGGEIVVKAGLNGTSLNAMVDTGATSSLSSFSAVPRVPGLEVLSAALSRGPSFGLGGEMARKTLREATLTFAGKDFPANGLPSVDLFYFSRSLESEIYLVIGFPELDDFILEIDYRTNTLYLDPND